MRRNAPPRGKAPAVAFRCEENAVAVERHDLGKIRIDGRLALYPIKLGLVASLNRPGSNITGVSFLVDTLTAKHKESAS
jgi:hypothetical protein